MALYLLLPNLAFVLLGREFFINRPLINIDYLFLWVGSCYLSHRTTIGAYAGLIGLDLVLSTESIYHFSTVDIILAARDFLEFEPVISCLIVSALLLAVAAALAFNPDRGIVRTHLSRRSQFVLGTAALAVTVASIARSAGMLDIYPATFGDNAIAASGTADTVVAFIEYEIASSRSGNLKTFPVREAATSGVVRDLSVPGQTAASYNVALIVVESQGLLKNDNDMRQVLAPLVDAAIQERYVVNRGAVRFHGATMFGELRALCRVYVPNADPLKLSGLKHCLPDMLRRLGYETVSYHGFNQWIYGRSNWYPAAGFQRSYFAEELGSLSPPLCGFAFRGVCDHWIAGQVEKELLAPGGRKKFVYWLTLNSHLPFDSSLAEGSSFDCERTESLREDAGPCDLARIHFQLYRRIAQMFLNERLPPTRLIVVGDHMPPFATVAERALYDNGRVPYVELIPRSGAPARASDIRWATPG